MVRHIKIITHYFFIYNIKNNKGCISPPKLEREKTPFRRAVFPFSTFGSGRGDATALNAATWNKSTLLFLPKKHKFYSSTTSPSRHWITEEDEYDVLPPSEFNTTIQKKKRKKRFFTCIGCIYTYTLGGSVLVQTKHLIRLGSILPLEYLNYIKSVPQLG